MNKTNLDEIKQRVDIVDVISTYVRLEKSGGQFKARCPFHNEKSPSFYVSPGKGFYHCFGCGAHGDIFSFTMAIEGLPFKDALKMMADKAGITLQDLKKEDSSKVFDVIESATLFFQRNLQESFEAREYVRSRGITDETVHSFRVGFALNDWRTLYFHLQKKGFTDDEILESGLCIKHEKGFYDRFRSRVMFPIMNASGKVVAFTGRIIGPDTNKDGVAKYVNSPETSVYHKSSILFAYDKAKRDIAKTKRVILVEGQMDAVMSHQAGVTDVVAISGTALTESHVNILKRFAENVVLSLDTDKAGFEAMKKSAQIALFHDMYVEAVQIDDAKDPADLILENPESWKMAVEKPVSIFTFLTKKIVEDENEEYKKIQRVRKEILPILASVKSKILQENFAKDIESVCKISKEVLLEEMRAINIYEDGVLSAAINTEKKEDQKAKNQKDIFSQILTALVFCEYSESKKTILEKFILNKLADYKEFENVEILENEDLKNIERIKIEKELTNKKDETTNEDIAKEHIFTALKAYLEKVKQIINQKNKENFEDRNFVFLQKINKEMDILKDSIEKL